MTGRVLYSFENVLSSANETTSPQIDGAKVSGKVASHTKRFPHFHGIIVAPSGLDLRIPGGSNLEGNMYLLLVTQNFGLAFSSLGAKSSRELNMTRKWLEINGTF